MRLIFQPAEEVLPGGAQEVIEQGGLQGVDRIFSIHCDPSLDVGQVGLRDGAITAAADAVTVTLSGRGGHTSRPHLTQDLTYALGKVVTDVPAALSRRVDPRAGVALVWGSVHSGSAPNVIPSTGTVSGTLRMLDAQVWEDIGPLLEEIVHAVVSPYAVSAKVEHLRGVPPVVNDPACVEILRRAAVTALGPDAAQSTLQSLGGEDYALYLQQVGPGCWPAPHWQTSPPDRKCQITIRILSGNTADRVDRGQVESRKSLRSLVHFTKGDPLASGDEGCGRDVGRHAGTGCLRYEHGHHAWYRWHDHCCQGDQGRHGL